MRKTLMTMGFLALALAGVGLVLPAEFRVERSVSIDAPPGAIFDVIARPASWVEWAPWLSSDAAPRGPGSGAGSGLSWANGGLLTLRQASPTTGIVYQMTEDDGAILSHGGVRMELRDGRTEVTWYDFGEVGSDLATRWQLVTGDVSRRRGDEQAAALQSLKRRIEGER